VSGYEVGSTSVALPTGSLAFGTFPCPAGKKVVGGGWDTDGANAGANVFITKSAPTTDGTGWIGSIQNNSGATVNVTLTRACITAPGSSASVAKAKGKPVLKIRKRSR
jgi:hypothetical protein